MVRPTGRRTAGTHSPVPTELLPTDGVRGRCPGQIIANAADERNRMTTIDGLPAHILLLHAVIVLVPLTAVLTVLTAVWPTARARLGLATAVLAVVMLAAVPLTTEAGEWLEHHVARNELVRTHTELGDTMLPWAIALAVVAVAVGVRDWLAARSAARARVAVGAGAPASSEPAPVPTPLGGRPVTVALAVLAVVVAVGSVVTVYRIGESGARAAWTGQFSQQATAPVRPGAGG
jgi:hypothetical protein